MRILIDKVQKSKYLLSIHKKREWAKTIVKGREEFCFGISK